MTQSQYCTFNLDKFNFGVDVRQVQEVVRFQPMWKVPLAHRVVRGLINLRGQIVMAIDLRLRLELPPANDDMRPTNIIVRTGDDAVSFLVDEVCDVMEVDQSLFEPPPDTLKGSVRNLIAGTYKLEDRLLLILDTDKAAELDDLMRAEVQV